MCDDIDEDAFTYALAWDIETCVSSFKVKGDDKRRDCNEISNDVIVSKFISSLEEDIQELINNEFQNESDLPFLSYKVEMGSMGPVGPSIESFNVRVIEEGGVKKLQYFEDSWRTEGEKLLNW